MLKERILYPANAAEQPPSTRLPVLFCREYLERHRISLVSVTLKQPEDFEGFLPEETGAPTAIDPHSLLHRYPVEYFVRAIPIADGLNFVYREKDTGELCAKYYSLENIQTICFTRHLPKRPPAGP